MTDSDKTSPQEQPPAEQKFAIQRIYIKDMSFETPNSPDIFKEQWAPQVNVEINSRTNKLEAHVYEVILSVTVTAKLGDKTAYLAEVQQAGIFVLNGFKDNDLNHMLGSYCPTTLFPYSREAISDLVAKGSFPQLLLAPVNFDALFAQHLQQQQAAKEQPVH